MIKKISEMKDGEVGKITLITHMGSIRRRLCDIGFDNGSIVEYICHAPLNDPIAFRVKGSVFALRKKDADKIIVLTEK